MSSAEEGGAWHLGVHSSADPLLCQGAARSLALSVGFSPAEAAAWAIAVSELACNIVRHAQEGTVSLTPLTSPVGVEVVAADRGPGISEVALAMQDGFSEGHYSAVALAEHGALPKSLGCGLGAVRRLTDECEIDSATGRGTTVTARKWLRPRGRR